MSEANGERSTRHSEDERAFSRDRYDAVLLDLDGVITDTASIHAACWKQMFDEYLQKRATQKGEVYHPFDSAADYRDAPRQQFDKTGVVATSVRPAHSHRPRASHAGVYLHYYEGCRARQVIANGDAVRSRDRNPKDFHEPLL